MLWKSSRSNEFIRIWRRSFLRCKLVACWFPSVSMGTQSLFCYHAETQANRYLSLWWLPLSSDILLNQFGCFRIFSDELPKPRSGSVASFRSSLRSNIYHIRPEKCLQGELHRFDTLRTDSRLSGLQVDVFRAQSWAKKLLRIPEEHSAALLLHKQPNVNKTLRLRGGQIEVLLESDGKRSYD